MPGWWSVTGNEKGAGIAAGALDDQERELRIELMTVQIEHYQQQIKKADFDMGMELRKLRRQTLTIAMSAMGIVVAAFASGAAWWNYLHH
jgi:hypothetical protein